MKRIVLVALLPLLAVAYVAVLLAQEPKTGPDPSFGTWVLNAQQARFAGPALKAFIERYDRRPDGFFVSTRSIINNDGSPAFSAKVTTPQGQSVDVVGVFDKQ